MGKADTQSIEVKRIEKHEKFALGGYAPAARAPPNCDSAVLPTLVPSLIAPRPPRGTHWRKRGGDHDARKWFSTDEKNMRLFPHWGLIIDIPLKKTGKPAHVISVIRGGITHNVMRDQDFASPVFLFIGHVDHM